MNGEFFVIDEPVYHRCDLPRTRGTGRWRCECGKAWCAAGRWRLGWVRDWSNDAGMPSWVELDGDPRPGRPTLDLVEKPPAWVRWFK